MNKDRLPFSGYEHAEISFGGGQKIEIARLGDDTLVMYGPRKYVKVARMIDAALMIVEGDSRRDKKDEKGGETHEHIDR